MKRIALLFIINACIYNSFAEENLVYDILDVYSKNNGKIKSIETYFPDLYYSSFSEYFDDGRIKTIQLDIYLGNSITTLKLIYEYFGNDSVQINIYSDSSYYGGLTINYLLNDGEIIGIHKIEKSIIYSFITDDEGRFLFFLIPFSYPGVKNWWNDFTVIDKNNWTCTFSNLNDDSQMITIKMVSSNDRKEYFIESNIDNTHMVLEILYNQKGDIREINYRNRKNNSIINYIKYEYLKFDNYGNWIECIENNEIESERHIIRKIEYK
jgi:hypothetical protein